MPLWDRVMADVQKGPGCWLWRGYCEPQHGYGRINDQRCPSQLAHRVVFELVYGPLPKDHLLCHHCDNPTCVHPLHMFVGTHEDNRRDCATKGRATAPDHRGTKNPLAKCTEQQVIDIWMQRNSGKFGREVGAEIGVSWQCVLKIWRRQLYTCITDSLSDLPRPRRWKDSERANLLGPSR